MEVAVRTTKGETIVQRHWRNDQDDELARLVARKRQQQFRPRTPGQQAYFDDLQSHRIVVCLGPAGSGKTFVPCAYALQLLFDKKIDCIYGFRPLVTCGQGPGTLPGDLGEKTLHHVKPLLEAFTELAGAEAQALIRAEKLKLLPPDHFRGSTLRNAFVLVDESQNYEYEQARMLATRMGPGSRIVFSGDPGQSDLSTRPNALVRLALRLEHLPGVAVSRLTHADIVRDPLVRLLDEALGDGPDEYDLPEVFRVSCPRCQAHVWFEQPEGPEVERVRCWRCRSGLFLPDGEVHGAKIKLFTGDVQAIGVRRPEELLRTTSRPD